MINLSGLLKISEESCFSTATVTHRKFPSSLRRSLPTGPTELKCFLTLPSDTGFQHVLKGV